MFKNKSPNVKVGISISSAIIRFTLTYIIIEILLNIILFGIVIGICILFKINNYKIEDVLIILKSILSSILSIIISTKIICYNYTIQKDIPILINKLHIVWIVFLILAISSQLYCGYKNLYTDIITLEAAEVGYRNAKENVKIQQDGCSTNQESIDKIKERKRDVIKEDLIIPIATSNTIFAIQIILTNTYLKNKFSNINKSNITK